MGRFYVYAAFEAFERRESWDERTGPFDTREEAERERCRQTDRDKCLIAAIEEAE